jgi:hypothetical protein
VNVVGLSSGCVVASNFWCAAARGLAGLAAHMFAMCNVDACDNGYECTLVLSMNTDYLK